MNGFNLAAEMETCYNGYKGISSSDKFVESGEKMISIAIVEDELRERNLLREVLERFSREEKETFKITEFHDAMDFLADNRQDYQIVFMDIQMPFMDGMEAAQRFRKRNKTAVLIFITGMVQYAVKGYEVNALDYIVKPVNYHSFVLKMKRAVLEVRKNEDSHFLINTKNGVAKIRKKEIQYVEVQGHQITYHTDQGDIQAYGTMKETIERLGNRSFALCNKCYYVNLYYVTAVVDYTVKLGETELQISHPRKKEFLKALNDYVGGISI